MPAMSPLSPVSGRLVYDTSETCADLLYATRFMAPDPFLWYETVSGAGIAVTALEVGRARKQTAAGLVVHGPANVRTTWDIGPDTPLTPDVLIPALSRSTGVCHWSVPNTFPLGLARTLEAQGLTLEPTETFFPGRATKTDAEVEQVRTGVRLAEAGLDRALAVLGEAAVADDGCLSWQGRQLTADILRGEISAAIARLGGTASNTITAPGPQAADPHCIGEGAIRAGVPIVLDIFPRVDATGYYGDLTRTVVKGKAGDTVKRAHAAVREAQQRAMDAVRAGVPGRDVHQQAAETIARHGFTTDSDAVPPLGFFHGTGHGLGLEIHEPPRVNAEAEALLEAGNVVTIEPGVYYPEWGGMRLEDVVAVRGDGCENLTSAGFELELE